MMIYGSMRNSSQHAATGIDGQRAACLHSSGTGDQVEEFARHTVAYAGNARFRGDAADVARERGTAAAWLALYERFGADCPAHVGGSFAVAIHDASEASLFLAVDRFSVNSLCYGADAHRIAFAGRADKVDALLGRDSAIDPQGIYDYLHFHVIPAPRTVFSGVCRLEHGHYLLARAGRIKTAAWWRPNFVESEHRPLPALREEFLGLLQASVADRALPGNACFLSGGTDSSTVAGMVGLATGSPARTYSIGFDADGYDEMAYARVAARHFGTDHHEYYVTPDDLVRSIPGVAAHYDQPFGNSSALPGYYCARMARAEGNLTILAGDGGDELFGGNSRYAKQRIFEAYGSLPRFGRQSLLEPILLGMPLMARLPGVRKLSSYVEQARVPMPERMHMYNLLLRLGAHDVLDADFLASIDPSEPPRMQRETYAACTAPSLINRMLAYDWKFTLADNDLPKVVGTTALAGIRADFPLLDERLVDFSLRLHPALKLRGLTLRWFFKQALRDFLPEAIIRKKKHGFGLPFGPWVASHAELRNLAGDSLQDLKQRGIIRPKFIDDLMQTLLPQHPGYYGEMVWILMMLEQWLGSRRTSS